VHLFDPVSYRFLRAVDFGKGEATRATFHPDGEKLAVGAYRGFRICVIDVASATIERELKGHETSVTALAFDPLGTRLASGSSNRIRIWDWEAKKELRAHWVHRKEIQALQWRDDSSLISGSEDGTLRLTRLRVVPNGVIDDYFKRNWFVRAEDGRPIWNLDVTEIKPGFIDEGYRKRLIAPESQSGPKVDLEPHHPRAR
jgi:WD40 repeat protein